MEILYINALIHSYVWFILAGNYSVVQTKRLRVLHLRREIVMQRIQPDLILNLDLVVRAREEEFNGIMPVFILLHRLDALLNLFI